jgi:hypothetical protein
MSFPGVEPGPVVIGAAFASRHNAQLYRPHFVLVLGGACDVINLEHEKVRYINGEK